MHSEPIKRPTANNLTNVAVMNGIATNSGPRNLVILEIIDNKHLNETQHHHTATSNIANNFAKELTRSIRSATPIPVATAQTITIDRQNLPNTIITVTTATSTPSSLSTISLPSTNQTKPMPKIQLRKTSISPIITTAANAQLTLTNEPRATILATGMPTTVAGATTATAVIAKKPSTGIILLSQASLSELLQTVEFNNCNNNNNNSMHTDKNSGGRIMPMMTIMTTGTVSSVTPAIKGDKNAGGTNHLNYPKNHHQLHHSFINNTNNILANHSEQLIISTTANSFCTSTTTNTINSNNNSHINTSIITNNIINKSNTIPSILMINSSALTCSSSSSLSSITGGSGGGTAATHVVTTNHLGEKQIYAINQNAQVNIDAADATGVNFVINSLNVAF